MNNKAVVNIKIKIIKLPDTVTTQFIFFGLN